MVGDDNLGGHFGEPPSSVLDGLLGVTEHRLGVLSVGFGTAGRRVVIGRPAARSGSSASSSVESSAT